MKRALIALLAAMLLASAAPSSAAATLESRIQAATGIVRVVDVGLQARAAVRAIEIQTDFNHCCLEPDEAEVIAWNSGYADPLGQLVIAWLDSGPHAAILIDPYWHSIGCATAVKGERIYGVCLFRGDPAFDTPGDPGLVPGTIPDTAMRAR